MTGDHSVEDTVLWSVATHTVCIAAVHYGSHYTLRRWIAVQSLRPPHPQDSDSTSGSKPTTEGDASATEESKPPVKRRSKWSKIKLALELTGVGLGIFALEMLVFWGLRQIKSVLILDLIWSAVELWLMTSVTSTAVKVLWPFPQTIKYAHSKNSKAVLLSQSTEAGKPIYPKIVGGIFAASVIGTSAKGIKILQPLVIATWVLSAFSAIEHNKMITKWVILLFNGFLGCTAVLSGLIMGGIEILDRYDLNFMANSKGQGMTSDWLSHLMMSFGSALPAFLTAFLIPVALRYDYSNARITLPETNPESTTLVASDDDRRDARARPGEAVDIPRRSPTFHKPMYTAAMVALTLSLGVLDLGTYLYPEQMLMSPGQMADMLWTAVSFPLVSLCTMYVAWKRGSFRDWWLYEERWSWNGGESDKKALEAISEGGNSTSPDEKRSLAI